LAVSKSTAWPAATERDIVGAPPGSSARTRTFGFFPRSFTAALHPDTFSVATAPKGVASSMWWQSSWLGCSCRQCCSNRTQRWKMQMHFQVRDRVAKEATDVCAIDAAIGPRTLDSAI
jgi:hypothetical protein